MGRTSAKSKNLWAQKNTYKLQCNIQKELGEAFELALAANGETKTEVIRRAVIAYIDGAAD